MPRLNSRKGAAKVGGLPAATLGGSDESAESLSAESPPSVPRLIVAFAVEGRPVPWSVGRLSKPMIRRRTTRKGLAGSKYRIPSKSKALMAWQQEIFWRAQLAMGGIPPYDGAVTLKVAFRVMPRSGRKKVGDWCNYTKAFEDALQGAVIVNDRQVCGATATRTMVEDSQDEGVWAEVWTAAGSPDRPVGEST